VLSTGSPRRLRAARRRSGICWVARFRCGYGDWVATLAGTSLTVDERALLERFAALLRERLGARLRAVWLYGSRARGEAPAHEDSDVDVLVLVDDASWEGKERVHGALDDAAGALGLEAVSWSFSVHVETRQWLAGRRAIKSFFIAEVDRDKVIVEGCA
jgi:predicted nucleotidyltransferase